MLKGAMLLRVWSDRPYRATLDLDLLRRGDGAFDAIRGDLRAIVAEPAPADAVEFDGDRNSQIKDFFDLHHMATRFEFDRAILVEAVRRTFEPYPGYKDSGVEWRGGIPANGNVMRGSAASPV